MTVNATIVVPAYNEENRIRSTLEEIIEEFPNQEVIVVCDGCTDKTPEIVREFKKIKLIESEQRQGKGGAIVQGLDIAKGEVVGFLDADGSFHPKDVRKLITEVQGDVDCVIASKWVGRKFTEVGETTTRKLFGRIWNLMVNSMLGLGLNDTQAGAKFLKNEVYKKIGGDFVSTGFEFDVEILYRVVKHGYKIKEIYVPFEDVAQSTFNYTHTLKMFYNLVRIWWYRNSF